MYVLDKNDKKQIPPRGIGTRAQDFRKTNHTTTQHATLHPLPICSTASLFPLSLPFSALSLVLCLVFVYYPCIIVPRWCYYTMFYLYQHIIYNISILIPCHSNTIYLYYIYISILLVYLLIHYYIAILFYNQHSILYYNSISIYLFYCLDLCIYISILFLSV